MKNLLYFTLIFSLLAISVPDSHTLASGGDKIESDLNMKGTKLIEEKRFDELIKVARDAITEDTTSAPAYRLLVLGWYYGEKDLQKLGAELEARFSGKSTDAYIHYGLGFLYYLKDDMPLSEKHLRQSIAMNPNVALARNNLGAVLSKQHKFEEALVHIRAALKIDPELQMAKNNLENTLLKMNPPTKVESLDELIKFFISALREDDIRWLETLILKNKDSILENRFLRFQFVNSLLNKGVENGLADDSETEKSYFRIAAILAAGYFEVTGNESLQARVRLFRDWSNEDKAKYKKAKIAYTLSDELMNRNLHNKAIEVFNKVLALYREIKDPQGEAECLQSLGEAHLMLDEYEKAREYYEQGLVIFRRIKALQGEADCLQGLGEVHAALFEYKSARELYELGIKIYREIEDRPGEAIGLKSLGDVHMSLSEYESARDCYKQGLVIFREVKSRIGEAECLRSLGDVQMGLSEYETARGFYDQGLVIFRELKDRKGEAGSLIGLGDVYRMLSENELARDSYEQGLVIFRRIEDRLGEADSLKSLANIFMSLSNYGSARDRYEQGLVIFREIKDRPGEALCLRGLGHMHWILSEHESAREFYEQAIAIFRGIGDRQGEAICLRGLGDVHRSLDEYESARKRYKQALIINREIKNRQGEANCLISLGNVQQSLSEHKSAMEFYEQGLVIYREIKARQEEAGCLRRLGDVHRMLSEVDLARERYEQGLVIYREIKVRQGEANCLQRLGDVYFMLSEYESARKYYNQALVIFREIDMRLGEAACLLSLGTLHRMLSEYESARKCYNQGLVIYREINDRRGEANSLLGLGDLHRMLYEYKSTEEWYEQGLEVFRESEDLLGEANCLHRLGEMHRMFSEYKSARARYEQALMIFRKIKARRGEANCLKSLGNVHKSLSEYDSARKRYEQGLTIFREIKAPLGEANSLQNLGDVNMMLSEYDTAREFYEKGLALHKKIGEYNGVILTTYRLGQLYEKIGDDSKAEKFYQESIENMEEVLLDLKTEEYKRAFLSGRVNSYEAMIALLFKTGNGVIGLDYAERSRARSFLYLLGNKKIDPKKGIPPGLVSKEEELRKKITLKRKEFDQEETSGMMNRFPRADAATELLKLQKEHRDILFQIKLHSPEYAAMKSVDALTGGEIQDLIEKNNRSILLEYYITDNAVYLWAIDGGHIRAHVVKVDEQKVKEKVERFHAMAGNASFGVKVLAPTASELYDLLLKPVESELHGKDRIGIIPHGVLHYLPFEALMKDNRFLTEHGIKFFYLPSGSSYKYCKEKNDFKNEQLLAFGNPDGSLPFSEEETRELKELYTGTSEIFIGDQAKEGRVKDNAGGPDILHFSSHGEYLPDAPLYSALLLARDSANDGRLEVHEIFQLKLKPAYLVTLSACETKLGGIHPGDEIVGMNRAFIYAGTPSILASLWKVDDYYTRIFMIDFYRALKKHDKIVALHIARQKMIDEHGKRHPFYWAAFVLSGDYR